MSEYEEMQVREWLASKGHPYQIYDNLLFNEKNTLHNLLCTPAKLTTTLERMNLYKKLNQPDIARQFGPSKLPSDEEIRKYFAPVKGQTSLNI